MARPIGAKIAKTTSPLLILAGLLLVIDAIPHVAYAAPEIDPGSVGNAVTLLIGGLLVLAGMRRKRGPQDE